MHMKKMLMIVAMILTLSLVCSAMADTVITNPGKEVEVNIEVSSKDAAITTLLYTYDKNALEYSGTEVGGSTLKEGDAVTTGKMVSGASDGKITLARLGEAINGIVGKLKFKAKDSAKTGTYTVDFSTFEAYNEEEKETTVNVTDQNVLLETLINSFVRRCYSKVLGRDPDQGGLNDWSNALMTGERTAAEIVSGFMNSSEYLERKNANDVTVEILYETMLDRGSDEAGKQGWVDILNGGGESNAIIKGFCGSQEFMGICDEYGITAGTVKGQKYSGVKGFVERCYTEALDRDPDATGLDDWTQQLLNGRRTANEVAKGFVLSPEVTNKNLTNEEKIDMLYHLYMGRDADSEGKANWLNKMNGGMTLEEVCNGFAGSQEFLGILNRFGVH